MASHVFAGSTKRLTLALVGVGWAAAALVLLMASAAGMVLDRPLGDFTMDPVTALEGPAYIGFVSSVGAVGWSLGCGACLVGSLTIDGRARLAFLCGGLLTAVLLADDLFLIHEAYIEFIGLPPVAAPVAYAGLAIAYIVVFRDFLRAHGIWLLPLACALLAVSAAVDTSLEENAPFIVEDGTKLLGIVTWSSFFVAAAVSELRSLTASKAAA
jgi:hypothetical protein